MSGGDPEDEWRRGDRWEVCLPITESSLQIRLSPRVNWGFLLTLSCLCLLNTTAAMTQQTSLPHFETVLVIDSSSLVTIACKIVFLFYKSPSWPYNISTPTTYQYHLSPIPWSSLRLRFQQLSLPHRQCRPSHPCRIRELLPMLRCKHLHWTFLGSWTLKYVTIYCDRLNFEYCDFACELTVLVIFSSSLFLFFWGM